MPAGGAGGKIAKDELSAASKAAQELAETGIPGKLKANNGNVGQGVNVLADEATVGTVISPEMEEKILFGQRKVVNGLMKNEIIGAHSGEITNANPKYAVQLMEEYADGTSKVKILTQFPDGTLSRIKTSTLFPQSWTASETIDAVKEVANSVAVARRADGVSLYQGTVRGVRVEVIKDGANVTSAYPCGKGCSDPKVFEGTN